MIWLFLKRRACSHALVIICGSTATLIVLSRSCKKLWLFVSGYWDLNTSILRPRLIGWGLFALIREIMNRLVCCWSALWLFANGCWGLNISILQRLWII